MKKNANFLIFPLIIFFICFAGCIAPNSHQTQPSQQQSNILSPSTTVPGAYTQVKTITSPSYDPTQIVTSPQTITSTGLLSVQFLDIGQGDAILIQTPGGKSMLIDAGPADAGTRVTSYLKSKGISSLDMVVATHPHEDHIGGIAIVLNSLPVQRFIDSGYPHTTQTYESMLQAIDQKNIPYATVAAGDRIDLDPSLAISVLNPQSKFSDDVNQNSIVLKVTYGHISFLFMGDAGSESENTILNSGTDISATILKVAHHGSSTSSSATFLSKVRPEVSVIEVGAGNPYDHPAASTLTRLSNAGSQIYRTDLNGNILVKTDGNTYSVTTDRTGSAIQTGTQLSTTQIVTTSSSADTTKSASAGPTQVCDCSSNLYNCKDFPHHAAAQACYDYCKSLGKGDVHGLDGDHDGLACEG